MAVPPILLDMSPVTPLSSSSASPTKKDSTLPTTEAEPLASAIKKAFNEEFHLVQKPKEWETRNSGVRLIGSKMQGSKSLHNSCKLPHEQEHPYLIQQSSPHTTRRAALDLPDHRSSCISNMNDNISRQARNEDKSEWSVRRSSLLVVIFTPWCGDVSFTSSLAFAFHRCLCLKFVSRKVA